jgi:hypothetical protein
MFCTAADAAKEQAGIELVSHLAEFRSLNPKQPDLVGAFDLFFCLATFALVATISCVLKSLSQSPASLCGSACSNCSATRQSGLAIV